MTLDKSFNHLESEMFPFIKWGLGFLNVLSSEVQTVYEKMQVEWFSNPM